MMSPLELLTLTRNSKVKSNLFDLKMSNGSEKSSLFRSQKTIHHLTSLLAHKELVNQWLTTEQ